MSAFTPRSSQDLNRLYPNAHVGMTQLAHGHDASYVYAGQSPYAIVDPSFSNYSPQYASTYGQSPPYATDHNHLMTQTYPQRAAVKEESDSHSRANFGQHVYPYSQSPRLSRNTPMHGFVPLHQCYQMAEIESQQSPSSDRSEPIDPPLPGYPAVNDFDAIVKNYIEDLSPKKRDKALITSQKARSIRYSLIEKKGTAVESAQFRFWARKMFKFSPEDDKLPYEKKKIVHDEKPVAIREKLFKILTKAHEQCNHGGRDKTSGQVRHVYSWYVKEGYQVFDRSAAKDHIRTGCILVASAYDEYRVPKELIARYVKICPTCRSRRGTAGLTPPHSRHSSPRSPIQMGPSTPPMLSPPESRRDSMVKCPLSEPNSTISSPSGYGIQGLQNHQFWSHAGHMSPPQMAFQAGHNSLSSAYGRASHGFPGATAYGAPTTTMGVASPYLSYETPYATGSLDKREGGSDNYTKGEYVYGTTIKREAKI
ncbi:MAG: hypothetical protein Q9227_004045 [Pyrenula ochraceoflavens]